MEKLSISQASKQFGISRARLYKLLDKGAIVGYKSMQKGRGAGSWIDSNSLIHRLNTVDKKGGRSRVEAKGEYLPPREAAKKVGYTIQNVNLLVRNGYIEAKQTKFGRLVFLPSLLKYKENKIHV